MSALLEKLLHLSAGWVYALVGLLVFAEDSLFVGFVLPGETAAILGGVAAGFGHVPLPAILALVIVAAILGDSVGYEIGRRYGTRLLETRPLVRRRERIDAARRRLAARGGPAVFAGRFVAFLHATMPVLAGLSHMRYRTFLAYNAAGGIVWGTATVVGGYFAGNSYQRIEHVFGRASAIIVGLVVIAALIAWRVHRHRHPKPQP
jgi:membrane-associated protein